MEEEYRAKIILDASGLLATWESSGPKKVDELSREHSKDTALSNYLVPYAYSSRAS